MEVSKIIPFRTVMSCYVFYVLTCVELHAGSSWVLAINPCSLAYSYLHSCEPPIIHGNLTCDTIFIQHNGLIKIGSGGLLCVPLATFLYHRFLHVHFPFFIILVAPDTINNHVKTCREEQKSLHFFAPEYGGKVQSVCHLPEIQLTYIIINFSSAFSCCQCYHSCGYIFLWNVRLRGNRTLVLL